MSAVTHLWRHIQGNTTGELPVANIVITVLMLRRVLMGYRQTALVWLCPQWCSADIELLSKSCSPAVMPTKIPFSLGDWAILSQCCFPGSTDTRMRMCTKFRLHWVHWAVINPNHEWYLQSVWYSLRLGVTSAIVQGREKHVIIN